MTVAARVVSAVSVESAPNFEKSQNFDMDETSVSATEEII